MKKLLLLLLFIPLVSFGQETQQKNNEFDELKQTPLNLDDVPMFRSRKNVFKSQRMNCFQNKMNKHISKHFYYPKYEIGRASCRERV